MWLYDVTSQLQNGDNAIGVLLGNGWYNHQSKAVWDFDRALGATVPLSVWTCALPTPMEAWRLFPPISVGGQRRVQSLLIVSILASTTMHVWSRKDGALRIDDSKWRSSLSGVPSSNVTASKYIPSVM